MKKFQFPLPTRGERGRVRGHCSRLLIFAGLMASLSACSSPREERRSAVVQSNALQLAALRDLTDIRSYIPDIVVDLQYASNDNVTGRPLYPHDMPCLLKISTAAKLRTAQELLRKKGCGLRVWDAWRPPEVQLLLVEAAGDTNLFADPKSAWSRHCSGTAVDITLVDAKGKPLPMPTHHDEGGDHAHYLYTGNSRTVQRNLYTLQRAMIDAGFQLLDTEWWHFDDADYLLTTAPVVFGHELGIHISDSP